MVFIEMLQTNTAINASRPMWNNFFQLTFHFKVDDYLRKKLVIKQALKFSWLFSHMKRKKIPWKK